MCFLVKVIAPVDLENNAQKLSLNIASDLPYYTIAPKRETVDDSGVYWQRDVYNTLLMKEHRARPTAHHASE